jgi:ankyrin repeat protein
MKHILLTTIAAVVLVGCGPSEADRALFKAVERGNIKAVKQQLAAGADVNAKHAKREDGITQLHFAVGKGHKEIVELLIAKGADVNAKSDGDWTPLHYAASNKSHKETVELLIAKGADVNAKDKKGRTPLFGAAQDGQKEIAELLIANGADVNAKYLDRSVPLHLATMFGQKEVVKILIEEGGDVNAINADGHTPLDMAEDHPEVANLLRKHGGKHSIFAATSQGNIEAVKEHLADGSDVNAKDGVGRTPLDRAEEDFLDSSELKAAKKEIAALLRKHGGQQSVDAFDTGN